MAKGKKTGGRIAGTPNKLTAGRRLVIENAKTAVADANSRILDFDSLDQLRKIGMTLVGMAAKAQRENTPKDRWLLELLELASKVCTSLLPYEHRRLATLEPQMETVVRPDGTVHVTISPTDAEL